MMDVALLLSDCLQHRCPLCAPHTRQPECCLQCVLLRILPDPLSGCRRALGPWELRPGHLYPARWPAPYSMGGAPRAR